MPDLGWVVHVLAAFATANFAATVFSGRARDFALLAMASGLVILTAFLGADWVVHPAAGMLLAFLLGWLDGGTRRWQQQLPMLGVALLSAAAFMVLGAGWLIYPLVVVLIIMGFAFLNNWRSASSMSSVEPGQSQGALPEQAGGLPFSPGQAGEAVPVSVAPASTPAAAKPVAAPQVTPADALTALHHDARLPAEARALLVALDLRTAEVQRALQSQGQTGTEAAYQARAIREEYAPTAVQAYLKLPRSNADTLPIEGSKTGRDLLCEQLNILLDATQRLLEASARSGGQELLTNGRFLREKFGSEGDLKL